MNQMEDKKSSGGHQLQMPSFSKLAELTGMRSDRLMQNRGYDAAVG